MLPALRRAGLPLHVTWAGKAGRATLAALLAIGVIVPAAGLALPAAAQDEPAGFSTAEFAPADSVVYVVASLDNTSEQWQLADTLLDRAGFGEAIDEAVAEDLKDDEGEDIPLDAILGGEVAVIVGLPALEALAEESMGGGDLDEMLVEMGLATPEAEPAAPEALGVAAVLDAGEPAVVWTEIEEEAADDGAREVDYEGNTILYTPPTGDEDGMAAARVGDMILFAATPQDLEPLIDTADGRLPAIATVPEFTTARDALPADVLMFAFTNSLLAQEADFGPFDPTASQFTGEAFTAVTIAADAPGFRMESVALPPPGETFPAGAANSESELLRAAPPDALFFSSAYNLGETGFLDAIGAVFISLALGMGGPMMGEPAATPAADASPEEIIAQQYEDAAALFGINLQTDLFHQLTGEYGGWLTVDMAGELASGLFASGTGDSQVVENTLMQLSFLAQGAAGTAAPVTTRQVDGGQVYVVGTGESALEFGLVRDNLVIGTSDAVDRFAGAPDDSLADNARFQAVMGTLPAEYNGLTYLDLERAIPLAETASEQADDFDFDEFEDLPDASESCANYATQEEAQAAYDAAEPDTFDLDQDFDGEVCEDFFTVAETTPDADDTDDADAIEQALADVDYSAIKAFAVVAYDEEGLRRSSSILYIEE